MPAPSVFEIFADALHAAYARLFARRVTHNRKAMHHEGARRGRGIGTPARELTLRIGLERTAREHARRCADILAGARAGRAAAVVVRQVKRSTGAARQRFAAAGTATRTAAREVAAVAASTARRVGAHRHVRGMTDAFHALAVQAVEHRNSYTARAAGERSIWQQGRRAAAW